MRSIISSTQTDSETTTSIGLSKKDSLIEALILVEKLGEAPEFLKNINQSINRDNASTLENIDGILVSPLQIACEL